jgi:hypothetical protein
MKVTVLNSWKKFPACYGTRRFITVFTTARHLSLSWGRWPQSTASHPTFKIHFNSTLPFTRTSFQAAFAFVFLHQYFEYISLTRTKGPCLFVSVGVRTAAYWLIVPLWTFQLWPPDAPAPTDAFRTSGGSWNLWAENNDREFCLNADFHGTLRVLLHAANLRHGTQGFTSLPKEGALRIFPPLKIRRLRPGFNPRTWVQRPAR